METSVYTLDPQPVPMVRRDALNLHIAVPCPMKVPFRQTFGAWIEQYNINHEDLPLHCPDVLACGSQELEDVVATAQCPRCLPDLIVTGDYALLFTSPLGIRFLREGHFTLDILAYTSWNVVQDLTVDTVLQDINSWQDLLSEEISSHFTVHGHLDRITYSLMNFFRQTLGDDAIPHFARKIVDIKHFSHIIKRFGSNDPFCTPFTLLPSAAVARIPSTKKVRVLPLREGTPLSPLILLYKPDKQQLLTPVLDYLRDTAFTDLLHSSGCILPHDLVHVPDSIIANPPFIIPDLTVSPEEYILNDQTFTSLYFSHLNTIEITSRSVPGGICR
jgi:hypothetical protein